MGAIRIINNSAKFISTNRSVFSVALDRMGNDILLVTNITIPYKEGDLQHSGEVEKIAQLKRRIKYQKPYAAYQEAGERKDGSHVVQNYTTPGTGKHALLHGAEQITKDALNYLKQAANTIKL